MITKYCKYTSRNLGLMVFMNWRTDWIICKWMDGEVFAIGVGPFLWKTARVLTSTMTFTNSRPVAAHGRKQALTKTNGGGRRGGWASGEVRWTDLSISRLHFQIGLREGGGESDELGPAFDESVCVRLWPFRWGPETNMFTYQTFPPQLLNWRKMRKMLWS